MTEITIELEESFVNSIGRQALERQIKDYLRQLLVKKAAKDILADGSSTDLSNEPAWEKAREKAWKGEEAKFKVYFKEAQNKAAQQS